MIWPFFFVCHFKFSLFFCSNKYKHTLYIYISSVIILCAVFFFFKTSVMFLTMMFSILIFYFDYICEYMYNILFKNLCIEHLNINSFSSPPPPSFIAWEWISNGENESVYWWFIKRNDITSKKATKLKWNWFLLYLTVLPHNAKLNVFKIQISFLQKFYFHFTVVEFSRLFDY